MRLAYLVVALSVATALAQSLPGQGFPRCFPACKFDFCGSQFFSGLRPGDGRLLLTATDQAFAGPICREGERVGLVANTGPVFVDRSLAPGGGDVLPLSEVGFGFSPTFFKSVPLFNGSPVSGIGHEAFQSSNQTEFVMGRCFGVPIGNYQVLGANDQVVDNKQGGDPMVDCLAFRPLGVLLI